MIRLIRAEGWEREGIHAMSKDGQLWQRGRLLRHDLRLPTCSTPDTTVTTMYLRSHINPLL